METALGQAVAAEPKGSPDTDVERTVAFLACLFPTRPDFAIRLWDGSELGSEGPARYSLSLLGPGAARRMFRLPFELALGEAYRRGDFEIEGDIFAAFDLVFRLHRRSFAAREIYELLRLWRQLPSEPVTPDPGTREPASPGAPWHGRLRDRFAVRYHYDLGNEFYRLWLDRQLVYSCGYFPTGAEDLDRAQELKLELVCRKLRLRPGERFLDIGCGWGGLLLYAVRNFGVKGYGVTLSHGQYELAVERVRQAGLSDRIDIELMDYRDLHGGPFDKVASIGMYEHVGAKHPDYFPRVYALLPPGGLFLNHAVAEPETQGRVRANPVRNWLMRRFVVGSGAFRDRYVFPATDVFSVSEANLAAERAGFEVRDVENLREHYALTLRHWISRLEANQEEAKQLVGEATYRTWRMYYAGAVFGFEHGRMTVNQTLFSKSEDGRTGLPLSRAELYR